FPITPGANMKLDDINRDSNARILLLDPNGNTSIHQPKATVSLTTALTAVRNALAIDDRLNVLSANGRSYGLREVMD
ncbi:MAG: hypothetical protein P8Y82_11880, partial [Methyloceanibacter sp.]